MFFVYVLESGVIGKRHIGSASDLVQRLGQHNSGVSRWTKHGRPWKLIYQESFPSRAEAVRRERYLKTGKGREELNGLLRPFGSSGG